MKYLIGVVLLSFSTHIKSFCQQNNQQQIATTIAAKMFDSLGLSSGQKDQVYSINIQLANEKSAVRGQYASVDSIRYHIQKIENTRDSLYHEILSHEKFLLYKDKKRRLVVNH